MDSTTCGRAIKRPQKYDEPIDLSFPLKTKQPNKISNKVYNKKRTIEQINEVNTTLSEAQIRVRAANQKRTSEQVKAANQKRTSEQIKRANKKRSKAQIRAANQKRSKTQISISNQKRSKLKTNNQVEASALSDDYGNPDDKILKGVVHVLTCNLTEEPIKIK